MSFAIEFISNEEIINEEPACYGKIIANDFYERFISPLTYWTQQDYKNQWRQALARFLQQKKSTCLITCIRDPKFSSLVEWWVLYCEEEGVYLQNELIFFKDLETPFNIQNPYVHIRDRVTVSDEGDPISEWKLAWKDVESFFKNMK